MGKKQASVSFAVAALSRQHEILRRETTFLRRELASRNSSEPPPPPPDVSSPYLPISGGHAETLDLLLHEADQLRYRINSLPSIDVIPSSAPEKKKKAKMMRRMSQALVAISQHMVKSAAKDGISSYHDYRAGWQSTWGCGTGTHGFFDDITTLSPMYFTCSTPGMFPYSLTTSSDALQIYSIKIIDVNPILGWPLYVYGVVASRDAMDRNRNILFRRSNDNCQKLTQDDPFLRLTGPSRAIVADDPDVTLEVELKIKYGPESQHTAVLSCNYRHWSVYDDTPELGSGCCKVQLSLEWFGEAIQATIVGVHVVEGGWPFIERSRVSCFLSCTEHMEVVLLDCRGGGEVPVGPDDYFRLSRNVVTVKLQETLRVVVQGYSEPAGCQAQEGYVDLPVMHCQTSEGVCSVGNSKVKVVVAWSMLVWEKVDLVMEGYIPP